tara:strand:+ start:1053 stop:1373 length:321 start_codon:yes stop_codon:yes gene_type:complete
MTKGTCGAITRKDYAKGRGKNPCGKTVSVDEPYEIYKHQGSGFEWRVLKKYQTPHKEAENAEKARKTGAVDYTRWYCAVKSPMTYGSWEYGDVYAHDVKTYGERVK